jgi:hypothetical protein
MIEAAGPRLTEDKRCVCGGMEGGLGFRRSQSRDSADRLLDSMPECRLERTFAARRAAGGRHGVQWHLSGIFRINKDLRRLLQEGCVLFVQHPFKNAPTTGFTSGSFIACGGSFSNCEGATEGGIPKSSRFRSFA